MRLVLPLCLALLAPSAHAAAYYFTDAGTRALGRGGAFVASADDLSAQYYNPAALIHIRGGLAMINVSAVDQAVHFDRADESGFEPFEPVENLSPPFAIPAFGVAHDFGLPNTTFAFGFYPPMAPDMSYDPAGPQRYGLVDSLVWQTYTGLSVAQRVTDWLTIGAGVNWTLMRAEQEVVVAMCLTGQDCGDDPEQDVHVLFKAWDPFRVSWNAGVLIQPHDKIEIGASVVPPIHFKGEGSMTADFGEDHQLSSFIDGTSFTDDDVTLAVDMPLIARLGVAVRPIEPLQIELAGVYEAWSISEEIRISSVDLVIPPNPDNALAPDEDIVLTDDVVLKTNYQDAFSVRLGGEYKIKDRYTARAGGFFETSGVPAETQGVALVDGNKWGVGLGGGVRLIDRLTLDLALQRTQIIAREITDSQSTLIQLEIDITDTSNSEIKEGKVVGNGSFESHLNFASLGLTWAWGQKGS